jgi:hypothetical protein
LRLPETILSAMSGSSRAIPNLPILEDAAAGNGFLNQYVDWDNVVRRVPLVLKLGDKAYPSLAAEALRLALGAGSYIGRAAGANNETSFGENTGLTAIRIGQLTVPTDAAGRVWLHYAPPQRSRCSRLPQSSAAISIARSLPIISCWSEPRRRAWSMTSGRPPSDRMSPGWRSTPS